MNMKRIAGLTAALLLSATAAGAQEPVRKVDNVTLKTLDGQETTLPGWGEQHLLIFYVDPDHHKQNEAFTYELEENGRAHSDRIKAFGILNLKDAPMLPNGIVRSMARKRTAKNGALVLADEHRILQSAWELGKCNNLFVLLFVTKEGEIVFQRKGELTEADKEAFYKVLDQYR